jgi:hypothetical protein
MSTSAGPNIVEDGLVLSIDPANQKSYSPNLVSFPVYAASNWGNVFTSAATVTAGFPAPDGTNSAVRFACNTSGQSLFRITFPNIAPNGTDTYTCSFYAKLISGTTGGLAAGLADTNPAISNYVSQLITNQWVRIVISGIPATGTRNFFDIVDNGTRDYVVDLWGVQVEKSSSATPFNPNYYGTTINDISNNSNNGTLTNSPIFFAEEKGGLLYNGTNTNITIPHNSSKMDFSLGQTVCMVLKPTTGSESARRNPYNQAYGGPGTMTHEPNRTINYYFGTNGGNNNPYVGRNSVFTVNTNELAFIAVSRNQSLNTCKWYKNGALISTQDAGGYTTTANGSSPILIGQGYTSNFLGNIYATYVYNRGLTDEEIKQNFNALRGRYGI